MNNDKLQKVLATFLANRLNTGAMNFFETSRSEIATGLSEARFSQLIALASRHARRTLLAPSSEERQQAASALPGWDPINWNLLETLRVALVLARTDLSEDTFPQVFECSFQYADEGESCAFYRAISLLPKGERFVWRAGEGCRSNMTSVFCAVACDNPYPVTYFDEIAWQQLVMKAIFIGVPVWRIYGLDQRLSESLASMLLDYIDERTSAGRGIPADAWLLLGQHWSDRAAQALERALSGDAPSRCAATLAMARAGQKARLTEWLEKEKEPAVRSKIQHALSGNIDPASYQDLLSESNCYAFL